MHACCKYVSQLPWSKSECLSVASRWQLVERDLTFSEIAMVFSGLVWALRHRLRETRPLNWQLNCLVRTEDCYFFFFCDIDGWQCVTHRHKNTKTKQGGAGERKIERFCCFLFNQWREAALEPDSQRLTDFAGILTAMLHVTSTEVLLAVCQDSTLEDRKSVV